MGNISKYILTFFCLSIIGSLFAQKQKPWNYRKFDENVIHFGFLIAGNTADFNVLPASNIFEKYGVTALENIKQPGGQIGIVTSLKLGTPLLRLRFLPSISFQERQLRYSYLNPDPTIKKDIVNDELINSTNLDFPLLLQFRTMRYNNFASYVIGGMQYSFDLQSAEKANQSFIDPFVKIKAQDWQGQVGVGVEFFAVFFKLGLEIKYSQGFNNVLIQDNTPVSNPIDQLRNKVWTFSIIGEG
jgi:hypothetical protein